MYAITATGLRELAPQIKLVPGHVYYMGASSSPSQVLITSVNGPDDFTFRDYPYQGRDRRGTIIERDLIQTGMATREKDLASRTHAFWADELVRVSSLIEGFLPAADPKAEIEANEPVSFTLTPKLARTEENYPERGGDPWYAAEHFGNVGGHDTPEGMVYVVNGYRYGLAAAREDGRFEISDVKPRVR